MKAPILFDAAVTRECERCPDPIHAGDLAAWLPATDETVCAPCADQVAAALPPVPA